MTLSGEHLRRPAPYQPPYPPDVEPIPLDDDPVYRVEIGPWAAYVGWALAAILFGVVIAWALPS